MVSLAATLLLALLGSVRILAILGPSEDSIFGDDFESGDTSAWGCSACHGTGSDPAPPPDLDGITTTTATGVGAHQSHLGPSAWHRRLQCRECHLVPFSVSDPGHNDTPLPAELIWGPVATADGALPSFDGKAPARTATARPS